MKRAINKLLIVVWMLIPAIPALLYGDNSSLPSQNIRAYDSAGPATSPTLGLLRITPEGNDVPAGRQIVFQFNRPVVPLGRMERDAVEIPIDISPEVRCQWRWINTRALACRLDKANALQPATRYHITVRPGIKTDDGIAMQVTQEHEFITARPKVSYSRFLQWRAPGWPRIQLTFNQPVTKESVEQDIIFQRGSQHEGL
jgi:hypothetical protein